MAASVVVVVVLFIVSPWWCPTIMLPVGHCQIRHAINTDRAQTPAAARLAAQGSGDLERGPKIKYAENPRERTNGRGLVSVAG